MDRTQSLRLVVPDPALVLLVGPSGSGKSTFARAHFRPTEIVSSDSMRAMLADDPSDQDASAEAFQVLAIIVNGRLRRRLTTVVDATNLRAVNRNRYRRMAARYGIPTVAICFDLPPQVYQAHNLQRPERVVDDDVVDRQTDLMAQALADLPAEDYASLYVLREPDLHADLAVERQKRS